MRPLHEVARNTRAGHFVWPGGGRSINLTSIEILPSSKSLTAPIPAPRSHISALLTRGPSPRSPPSHFSLSFSPSSSPPYFFFSSLFFPPRFRLHSLDFFLYPSPFDPTHNSVSCLVPVFSPLVSLSIMFSRLLFLFLLFSFPLFSLSNLSRDPRKTRMTGRERGK